MQKSRLTLFILCISFYVNATSQSYLLVNVLPSTTLGITGFKLRADSLLPERRSVRANFYFNLYAEAYDDDAGKYYDLDISSVSHLASRAITGKSFFTDGSIITASAASCLIDGMTVDWILGTRLGYEQLIAENTAYGMFTFGAMTGFPTELDDDKIIMHPKFFAEFNRNEGIRGITYRPTVVLCYNELFDDTSLGLGGEAGINFRRFTEAPGSSFPIMSATTFYAKFGLTVKF